MEAEEDGGMEENYRIPWLAVQLHSIPRHDMTLRRVRATFRLDSQQYKEVLSVERKKYFNNFV